MENTYLNAYLRGFIKAAALPGQPAMPKVNSPFVPKAPGMSSKLVPSPPQGVPNPALPIKPQTPSKAPLPPPQQASWNNMFGQLTPLRNAMPAPQPAQPLPPIILNRQQWLDQERTRDIKQPALSGYLKNVQQLQNDQANNLGQTFHNQGLIR